MSAKTCIVTYRSLEGPAHVVEVTADSLYEAAALALAALRKSAFIDLEPGPASRLEVEVREPSVRHVVTVLQVRKWLESGSKNPSDAASKRRMAEALRPASAAPPAIRR